MQLNVDNHLVQIVGILSLAFMEGTAVLSHTDGAFFLPVVAAIAGICGFQVGKKQATQNSVVTPDKTA
jgi:hypothetical protein